MRIICPMCQIEMQTFRVGVGAESMTEQGTYQLYSADVFRCPCCYTEVIAGLGNTPISEHHQEAHATWLKSYAARDAIYQFWLNQREKEEYEHQHPDQD